jgi:hypothetical protein
MVSNSILYPQRVFAVCCCVQMLLMLSRFVYVRAKAIYDYAGSARKDLFPGGPDTYRSLCFERDDQHQSYKVFDNWQAKEAALEKDQVLMR